MRELEKIKKDIRKYETQYNKRLKFIAELRKGLIPLEAEAAILRSKLGVKEFTLEDWKRYGILKKELPAKRKELATYLDVLEKVEKRIDKLWKEKDEAEKLLAVPVEPEIPPEVLPPPPVKPPVFVEPVVRPPVVEAELIEIDDDSGYLIWYSPVKKKYFLVPEGASVMPEEYFSTLQIYLNYTFSTEKRIPMMRDPLGDGMIPARANPERLHAEMRIVITIREANKKVMDTLVDAVRRGFEEYITEVFGRARVQQIVPMFNIEDNPEIEEYPKKQMRISKLKQVLPEVLKVGRYCRLSNEVPNIDIDKETADLRYYAEWSDKVEPGYGGEWVRMGWRNLTEYDMMQQKEGRYVPRYEEEKARQPFDNFNLATYFRMRDRWHEIRSLRSGERVKVMLSVWEELKKLKEEEEWKKNE